MAARCAAVAGGAMAARCTAMAGGAVAALPSRPRPLLRPALPSRIGPLLRSALRPLPSRTLRSHPPARCFQVSAAKKAKGAADNASQTLSADQQERIRKNKEAARQLLAERNVPPGFGDSWRRQLAGEFSKPYFMEVSSIPRSPPAPSGC